MFVRIIRGQESIFFHSDVIKMTHSPEENSIFIEDPSNNLVLYEVPKEPSNEIYFMNDEGKTVDSYKWIETEYKEAPSNN